MAEFLVFVAAGLVGGAVNAAAGGAKLFVFPLLLATGLPPLVANATGTVAVWPANLPAVWVFRHDLVARGQLLVRRVLPGVFGGLAGALALIASGEDTFVATIPVLLVIACTAIVLGRRIAEILKRTLSGRDIAAFTSVLMFLCGFYGGYFGAGMGFMILAVVTVAGAATMIRANAEKNAISFCINTTAIIPLALSGLVDWVAAGGVVVGGLAGGYLGARIVKRVPDWIMRWSVAGIGVALTVSFLMR